MSRSPAPGYESETFAHWQFQYRSTVDSLHRARPQLLPKLVLQSCLSPALRRLLVKFDCSVSHWKRAVNALDFGLITGAADDDPSGITTYSMAGAQFGTLQASLFTQAIGKMKPRAKLVSVRAKRPGRNLRIASRQSEAEAKRYQSLLKLMQENPWCLL